MRKMYEISASPLYKIWSRNRLEQVLGFSRRELSIAANRPNYRRFRNERGRACEQPLGLTANVHVKLAKLLSRIQPPPYVKSIAGTSYVDNARAHVGDVPSVRMDISKFYPSTKMRRVWEFFRYRANCSASVATNLALICTYYGYLPTGSPISSYLSFFANMQMFDDLHALASSYHCEMAYTSYVDDIMFTGVSANRELLADAVTIVRKADLRHNRKKSGVLPAGRPKRITGVIVTPTGIAVPNNRQKMIGDLFRQLQSGDETCRSSLEGRLWEAAQIDKKFRSMVVTVRRKHAR